MNSMAQQAVPKGNGQKELRCAQSSRASNFVVTQLSPIMLFMGLPSRGISRHRVYHAFVTPGHKLRKPHWDINLVRPSTDSRGAGNNSWPSTVTLALTW